MPDHPEIYQNQAEQYDALISREDYQNNLFPALLKITAFNRRTVVELGAGTGRLTCQLVSVVDFIHAFDISQHMLDVAVSKLKMSGLMNWRVDVSDHRHIMEKNEAADVVISGWSVCYIVVDYPDTWQVELSNVLSEMRRVLRSEGSIILIETLGTGFESPEPPEHLISYYKFLEEHGFQRTWIRTDYRFESISEAERLTRFFFGESMLEKIQTDGQTVILPECTGIWTLKPV
jgi:ubiquinone/menaquinone biosynthesis C-methylase UbiE